MKKWHLKFWGFLKQNIVDSPVIALAFALVLKQKIVEWLVGIAVALAFYYCIVYPPAWVILRLLKFLGADVPA